MKKKIALFLAAVLAVTSFSFCSAQTNASEQTTYPTYTPLVAGTHQIYGPTIKTNMFAGCVWGCSVLSSRDEMIRQMGGYTDEQLYHKAEPVIYVADYHEDSEDRKLINEVTAAFGGTVVTALDIQLFSFTGFDYVRFDEINTDVEIIIGIPDEANYTKLWEHADEWEFAMVRVHDGKAEILKDTDTDIKTITFISDKFSIYGLVYAPIGNIDNYIAQQTSTSTPSTSDGELDEVPKMGDSAWEECLTFGMGLRRR